MITAAIVGGSGYLGGELLRILLGHPRVTVVAATSRTLAGRRADGPHPNLRGVTDLAFCTLDDLIRRKADVLLTATPHRATMTLLPDLLDVADVVIDLSGDFRLTDPDEYRRYYGVTHAAPILLGDFARGLPEMHRKELRDARLISVPGCMATAAILALVPPAEAGMIAGSVIVDARTGSSGSGRGLGPGGQHAERSGALRVFAPAGHRHEAEITQATGLDVRMSATGVPAVRGVQVLCTAALAPGVTDPDLRRAYRERYADEPFVRVVARRHGEHRYPDPKLLAGSNFCDIGFAVDPRGRYATLIGALDNLVKGGAGGAVQCLNVRFGWPERTALEFPGLHPS